MISRRQRSGKDVVLHCAMSWERINRPITDPAALVGIELIGAWVLKGRRTNGLTQQHVENLTGVDQTVISRLENGKLRNLRLVRLAAVVGVVHEPELVMRIRVSRSDV